jgi:putative oxidoreductase
MNRSKVISRLKTTGRWTLTVLLGLFFVLQGVGKFTPSSPWPRMFENWGFPAGFHLVVGGLELLAGIALFVPRISGYAASLLLLIMLGAFGTHALHAEGPGMAGTSVFALLSAVLAWLWLPRRAALRREVLPAEHLEGGRP